MAAVVSPLGVGRLLPEQAENVRIDLRRSIATMTNGGLFQAHTFHLYVSYHHVVVLI